MMRKYRRHGGKKIPFMIGLLLCFTAKAPYSMEPESAYTTRSKADWETKTLTVEISLGLAKAGLRMPGARTEAELLLERDVPKLVQDSLFRILLDSRLDIGGALETGALGREDFFAVLGSGSLGQGRFSADLREFSSTWSISLVELAAPFVLHERPRSGPRALDYRPTRSYSGILIFAKGSLPVRGEKSSSEIFPCLYPKIWDEEMNALMEKDLVDPGKLKEWGMVGYSPLNDSPDFVDRVGGDPLRITASAVFGTNRTDPVILREDALLILSNPANKKLIADGKVIIICENAGR
jgi:hypothetical protein